MNKLCFFCLILVLPLMFFGGCGKEKGEVVAPEADRENPVVDIGTLSAEEINASGRAQHAIWLAQQGDTCSVVAKSMTGWQLYVSVPFYSQCDPNWRWHRLGWSNLYINDYGCHLCCTSMLYAKWGYHPTMNPPGLNSWAKSHNGFSGAELIPERAIDYGGNRNVRYISVDAIYWELRAGRPVVVRVRFGNTSSHFMIIFAFDGQRYWVKDPLRDWQHQDQPLYGNAHPNHPYRIYGG